MPSIILVIGGLVVGIIGLVAGYYGWQKRKQHQLITETPTTKVQDIDGEGQVELVGEISGPADDGGFASPIGQAADTVFAAWEAEEWNESGDRSSWRTLATGMRAEPFYIDDGTDQVRVAIEDQSSKKGFLSRRWSLATEGIAAGGVVSEFEDFPVKAEVGAESDSPAHIEKFVRDEGTLSTQSGSITNLVDIGNAHGDRRYSEQSLGSGEEVYLIGNAQAANGATTPLHPEDVVITPTNDGTLILSNLTEDALIDRLSSSYRLALAVGVVAIVIAVGALVAGTTPIL
jgi:hypothetical protein